MIYRTLLAASALVSLTGAALAQDKSPRDATGQGEKKPSVTEAAGSLGGSVAGTVVGTTVGGPVGAVVGSTVGGAVGQGAGKVVHKVMHHKKKSRDEADQQQIAQAAPPPLTHAAPPASERIAPPEPTPTPIDDSATYRPTDDAPRSPPSIN